MRYEAKQVNGGWIVYDNKLMRPLSTNFYASKDAAEKAAAKFN